MTRRRDKSNSSTASCTSSALFVAPSSATVASTCAMPSSVMPGSRRGSSCSVPMESVTVRSDGSSRSFHGTHGGGSNAWSEGISVDSSTVQWSSSSSWYSVTDHCQPS